MEKEKHYYGNKTVAGTSTTEGVINPVTIKPYAPPKHIAVTPPTGSLSTLEIIMITMGALILLIGTVTGVAFALKKYRVANSSVDEPQNIEMPVLRKFRETAV